MRNVMLIVMFIVIGVLLYRAYQGGAFDQPSEAGGSPHGAVQGVVATSQELGHSSGGAPAAAGHVSE